MDCFYVFLKFVLFVKAIQDGGKRTSCPCLRKVHRTTRKRTETQTSETTSSQQPPTHHMKLETGRSSDVAQWVRHHHAEPGECPEKRTRREGQGQAEGGGFHCWALRPLGALHTPSRLRGLVERTEPF